MSTSQFLVLRCDRCGHEQAAGRDLQPDRSGWTVIGAQIIGERTRVGGDDGSGADCCPGCGKALFDWWREPSDPAEQPRAPSPPPAPVITIENRHRAVGVVVDALSARTAFVHDVIRRQPTEILGVDLVPGAMFQIDEAAAEIVDAVLEAFGLRGRRHRAASSGERPVSLPLPDPDAPAASNAGVSAPQGRPVETSPSGGDARGRQPEHPTP